MNLRGYCALVACLLVCLGGPALGANVIEPDDYQAGTNLSEALFDKGVTLEVLDSDNQPFSTFPVRAVRADTVYSRIDGFLGDRLFAHATVGFFNDVRRFSASFAFDVSTAGINVVSGWSDSVIRMEAYDAEGMLIDTDQTAPLGIGYSDTLTVSSEDAAIRQVIVYTPADQGDFARLDHLTYVPEPASVALLVLAGSTSLLRRRKAA